MLIERLYATKKTVFSIPDLRYRFLGMSDSDIRNFVSRSSKAGKMTRIAPGLYALAGRPFEPLELASKIRPKSYVSFETVLFRSGGVFQYPGNVVFSASDNTLSKSTPEWRFEYRKIKDSVLADPSGIDFSRGYAIATPERALLDRLYLSPGYHFDDLSFVDWDMAERLVPIYGNKRLKNEIAHLRKEHA